jgi:uncharacterized membrane protein (DUF485 family)
VQGNGQGTNGHADRERRDGGSNGAASVPGAEGTPELSELTRARRRFVVPALVVFAVIYGGFLLCVAYAQSFMATKVVGAFTWAYLWSFALILMTWAIALAYLRYSDRTLAPLRERAIERGPVAPRERVR